jgi:hypothetical protein
MFEKPLTDDQLKAQKRLYEYLFSLDDPTYYSEEWAENKKQLSATGSAYDRAAHDYLLRKAGVMRLKGKVLQQPTNHEHLHNCGTN